MRQIIYVKYNRTREERFRLKTEIIREDGTLKVEKTALGEAGAAHIRSFGDKYEKMCGTAPRIRFLKPQFSDDGMTVCFPYLEGETLGDELGARIRDGKIPFAALERAMAFVFPQDFMRQEGQDGYFRTDEAETAPFVPTPEFVSVFGGIPEGSLVRGRTVETANVDGLFENLMISDGRVYGIDYEWVFDFPVPAKFLHYRNLLYFYRRYEKLIKDGLPELFSHFGISGEEQEIFAGMEQSFQSYVHGGGNFGYMKEYEQPVRTLEYLRECEDEVMRVRAWCENLNAEIAERDTTIVKQQEVMRLTNNHVANLDNIITSLRSCADASGPRAGSFRPGRAGAGSSCTR